MLVALEGVARRAPGALNEITDELCALYEGVAKWTTLERYRDVNRLLGDYAPRIPWLGERVRGTKKKEMMAFTEDVVLFWKSIDAKKRLEEKVVQEAQRVREKEKDKLRLLSREEVEIARRREKAKGKGKGKQVDGEEGDEEKGEGEEDEQEEEDDDYEDDEDDDEGQQGDDDDEMGLEQFVDGLSQAKKSLENVESNKSRAPAPRHLNSGKNRPVEYMRHPNHLTRRVNTIQHAGTSLLNPFISPSNSSSLSPSPSVPPIAPHEGSNGNDNADESTTSRLPIELALLNSTSKSVLGSARAPHSSETVSYRRLLLAGYHESNLQTTTVSNALSLAAGDLSSNPTDSRLANLLKTRLNESEISDSELFGEGELEGYFRDGAEVEKRKQMLEKSGRMKDWPEFQELDEAGEKAWKLDMREKRAREEEEKSRKARKKEARREKPGADTSLAGGGRFGKLLGPLRGLRFHEARKVIRGEEIGEGSGSSSEEEEEESEGRRRSKRKRKDQSREDTVESVPGGYESFRSNKKSKIDQSTRERLARLLASEYDSDEDPLGLDVGSSAAGEVGASIASAAAAEVVEKFVGSGGVEGEGSPREG